MDLWNVVAAAAAVVSIATAAGFGLQRGRVINLRGDLTYANEKIKTQRTEIDDLKSDQRDDRATITKQANDIAVLQRVVTGEVHWQAISDLLDHHHQTAERHWTSTEEILAEMRDRLRRPM